MQGARRATGRVSSPGSGEVRLQSQFEEEKAEILRLARSTPRELSAANVLQLPAPVRRYLEVARASRNDVTQAAFLEQRGALRTAPGKPWMPFRSQQVYTMEPPAFVWLAMARVAPFVWVTAKDRFIGGAGSMHIRLADLVTVANASGPEIDQGAGLRYWGEVLAFPDMVLSHRLRWESMDAHHARFTVPGSDPKVSAVTAFGADGLPAATHAERYRDTGGKRVLTLWSGLMKEWRMIGGRQFPSVWESVWHLDSGDFLAVKMEILKVQVL
jgi:hypothetical protein